MLAKRTYKNQLTLPKDVLKDFGDVEYFDVYAENGNIVLKPVQILSSADRLRRIRGKIKALGMTEKDINAAIHWARGRNS